MSLGSNTAYLQWLKDKGILAKMYRYGLINHIPLTTLEVRNKVDALMRQGYSKGRAVRELSSIMRVSKVTIYSYIF